MKKLVSDFAFTFSIILLTFCYIICSSYEVTVIIDLLIENAMLYIKLGLKRDFLIINFKASLFSSYSWVNKVIKYG